MLRWHLLRLRTVLPLIVVVQVGLAVGVVVGFGFLVPSVTKQTAAYLSTGAATLCLVVVGLATAPQMVAQTKIEGTFEYTKAWPVPKVAFLLADMTVWLVTALPGVVLALVVAAVRFHPGFTVSIWAVPALLATAITSTALGYGLAYATQPMVTSLVAQFVVFVALMFSPITFPIERLPGWLAALHHVLPFDSMATMVRAGLITGTHAPWRDYAVVAVWACIGFALTLRVMARRP